MLPAQLCHCLQPPCSPTCHREVPRLVHQPLIFYNLPFFSMSQKTLLLFSESSAAHHKDKTETAKGCRSQGSFISSQHHAEEKLCLAPQRSMEIWQFVAVTPGPLPLFHGFCSSKKTKHHHPRMQKQAPIVFFKQTQSICSKTIRILINIQTSTYHSLRAVAWTLKRRATYQSSFSYSKLSSATFLVPPVKNPT